MMSHFICATCGTQFAATEAPPKRCDICEDDRQYVGQGGQKWMTLDDLRASYHNVIREVEPALTGIGTHPSFAIGQRALLVQTPEGNLLWDCITVLDDPTIAAVRALGGVDAIAISHPHYYSCMVEWAQAFEATIYLHEADQRWVMRPDPSITFWEGKTKLLFGNLTLICAGGHFPGGTVAHWPAGAEGRGVLLTGDIIHVVADRRYVTFMYSYPNMIPLPERAVRGVVEAVEPFGYDRIYGAWWEKVMAKKAREGVAFSAERYVRAIRGAEQPDE